ncbi:MAG: hypothetical protein N2378_12100 [Chloroflexaceae bacterium]|nr:hypothetical protein [Chloroflexaceae bacterium]
MSQVTPPGPDLDKLLALATDLARGGNVGSAHTLFSALTREYPQDARPWLGLAAVAASPDERRAALERVLALDPDNVHARSALQRLAEHNGWSGASADVTPPLTLPEAPPFPEATEQPPAAIHTAATAVAPPEPAEEEREQTPFPLLNAIMSGIILVLLVILGIIIGRAMLDGRPVANAPAAPTAPGGQPGAPGAAVTTGAPPTMASPLPSALPTEAATATLPATPPLPGPADGEPTAVTAPTLALPPTVLATPAPLPLGTVVDYDGWSITLLRPDYAVTLDGAIGDLRPSGRFVLAVVAVSNNQPQPRRIPPDLFVVRDASGRAYPPVPGASSAYLALYQRAQRGDLALEDEFAPSSGMRSVPLLFDVPPDAGGLSLLVPAAGPAGWPIGETALPGAAGP